MVIVVIGGGGGGGGDGRYGGEFSRGGKCMRRYGVL